MYHSPSIKLSTSTTGEAAAPSLGNVEPTSSLAFGGHGTLAAGGQKGSIQLWDTAGHSLIATAAMEPSGLKNDVRDPILHRLAMVAQGTRGCRIERGIYRAFLGRVINAINL
jgi:hypothetical protein